MSISYKKLWKLLIDKNLSKADLRQMTGIGASTFSRMNKNEMVSLEIIGKITLALNCGVDDIIEFSMTNTDN